MSTSPPPQEPLGRHRSPVGARGYLTGHASRTKGRRYPPDPAHQEIIAVTRCCGDGVHGDRARALIVVLWRAGLRIQEALSTITRFPRMWNARIPHP
jgi:hypothetical protein